MESAKNTFFDVANTGNLPVVQAAIEAGQPVNEFDQRTGLTALHYAVARDNLAMAKYLVAQGATCTPDRRGRWPTTLGAIMQVSGEMCDFIVDEEVKYDVGPYPAHRPK